MLKMRLQRIGRRNDASFRVIVTDSRRGPKSGKHIDLLGSYNPKLNQFQIDSAKAKEWIGKGVQVSDTLYNLLVSEKVIEGKKVNVLPKKSPIVKEVAEEEKAEAPAGEDTETEAPAQSTEEEVKTEESKEEEAPEVKEESSKAEEPKEEAKEETPSEETEEEKKKE